MFAAMEFVRDHGFLVLVRREGLSPGELVAGVGVDRDELPVVPLVEFEPDRAYQLLALMAPVPGREGPAGFCLLMAGFSGPQSEAGIREAGASLKDACERIARFAQPLASPRG